MNTRECVLAKSMFYNTQTNLSVDQEPLDISTQPPTLSINSLK